jgi:hypothetical protein
VWLSDVPLDACDWISVTDDDVILRVTLPYQLEDLAEYEWVEEITDPDTGEPCTKRYREWLVPAGKINGLVVIDLLEEDDVE